MDSEEQRCVLTSLREGREEGGKCGGSDKEEKDRNKAEILEGRRGFFLRKSRYRPANGFRGLTVQSPFKGQKGGKQKRGVNRGETVECQNTSDLRFLGRGAGERTSEENSWGGRPWSVKKDRKTLRRFRRKRAVCFKGGDQTGKLHHYLGGGGEGQKLR